MQNYTTQQQLDNAFALLAQLELVLAQLAKQASDVTHFDANCEAIRDELCELFD